MAQVKIYGLRSRHAARRAQLSDAIHAAVVRALGLPPDKRFHRFLLLDEEDFVFPRGERSPDYLIVEVVLFAGRTAATKRELVRALYAELGGNVGLAPADVEITLIESPRENWGIRGVPGDELALGYAVDV